MDSARKLFEKASQADPRMPHVWQAWGMLEQRIGDIAKARTLFQSALWACKKNADACKVWQVSCWRMALNSPCMRALLATLSPKSRSDLALVSPSQQDVSNRNSVSEVHKWSLAMAFRQACQRSSDSVSGTMSDCCSS